MNDEFRKKYFFIYFDAFDVRCSDIHNGKYVCARLGMPEVLKYIAWSKEIGYRCARCADKSGFGWILTWEKKFTVKRNNELLESTTTLYPNLFIFLYMNQRFNQWKILFFKFSLIFDNSNIFAAVQIGYIPAMYVKRTSKISIESLFNFSEG
jgi:hypothetical protein